MVFTNANTFSWMVFRAALANYDISSDREFATEDLYTEPFTVRLSSVLGATGSFFMRHRMLV